MQQAVAANPDFADGWRELAAQAFIAGDALAGDKAYARYVALWREPPELSDAARALSENRIEAAEKILRRRLAQAPHEVAALRLLAEVSHRQEDDLQVVRILGECLALAPGFSQARLDLVRQLLWRCSAPRRCSHTLTGCSPLSRTASSTCCSRRRACGC